MDLEMLAIQSSNVVILEEEARARKRRGNGMYTNKMHKADMRAKAVSTWSYRVDSISRKISKASGEEAETLRSELAQAEAKLHHYLTVRF